MFLRVGHGEQDPPGMSMQHDSRRAGVGPDRLQVRYRPFRGVLSGISQPGGCARPDSVIDVDIPVGR